MQAAPSIEPAPKQRAEKKIHLPFNQKIQRRGNRVEYVFYELKLMDMNIQRSVSTCSQFKLSSQCLRPNSRAVKVTLGTMSLSWKGCKRDSRDWDWRV